MGINIDVFNIEDYLQINCTFQDSKQAENFSLSFDQRQSSLEKKIHLIPIIKKKKLIYFIITLLRHGVHTECKHPNSRGLSAGFLQHGQFRSCFQGDKGRGRRGRMPDMMDVTPFMSLDCCHSFHFA